MIEAYPAPALNVVGALGRPATRAGSAPPGSPQLLSQLEEGLGGLEMTMQQREARRIRSQLLRRAGLLSGRTRRGARAHPASGARRGGGPSRVARAGSTCRPTRSRTCSRHDRGRRGHSSPLRAVFGEMWRGLPAPLALPVPAAIVVLLPQSIADATLDGLHVERIRNAQGRRASSGRSLLTVAVNLIGPGDLRRAHRRRRRRLARRPAPPAALDAPPLAADRRPDRARLRGQRRSRNRLPAAQSSRA